MFAVRRLAARLCGDNVLDDLRARTEARAAGLGAAVWKRIRSRPRPAWLAHVALDLLGPSDLLVRAEDAWDQDLVLGIEAIEPPVWAALFTNQSPKLRGAALRWHLSTAHGGMPAPLEPEVAQDAWALAARDDHEEQVLLASWLLRSGKVDLELQAIVARGLGGTLAGSCDVDDEMIAIPAIPAIRAIASLPDPSPEAVDALLAALDRRWLHVNTAAARALATLGIRAGNQICRMVDQWHQTVPRPGHEYALTLIASAGAAALWHLGVAVNDQAATLHQLTLAGGIGNFQVARDVAFVAQTRDEALQMLIAWVDDDEMRPHACAALGELGPRAGPSLKVLAAHSAHPIAVDAMWRIGGNGVVLARLQSLQRPDGSVPLHALEAWLAASDPSPEAVTRALEADETGAAAILLSQDGEGRFVRELVEAGSRQSVVYAWRRLGEAFWQRLA